MLKNGTKAPALILPSTDGEVSIPDSHVTCLIVYRGKFCPTTNKILTAYQDIHKRLSELKISLLALSTDSLDDCQALKKTFSLTFPLISDVNGRLRDTYYPYFNERKSGQGFYEPSLYITDIHQNISYFVISSGPKGLPNPGDVLPVLLYMNSHGGVY